MILEENEVINQLLNRDLKIIQRPDYFNFSLDSLLISEFVTITKKVKNILELGSGNGAIPLFLSQRTRSDIIGFEIQEVSYKLALKNIAINNLKNQIKIINDDMKNWENYITPNSQDIVITNPPFFKYFGEEKQLNDLDQLTLARHEISITLEDIIYIASRTLKSKGYFGMVHRPDRLLEILELMKKYNITPKKIQFCHTKLNKQAKILLIEGIKDGSEFLKILPPLICHDDNGQYSKDILTMFNSTTKK